MPLPIALGSGAGRRTHSGEWWTLQQQREQLHTNGGVSWEAQLTVAVTKRPSYRGTTPWYSIEAMTAA